jgi:hypothetical protein
MVDTPGWIAFPEERPGGVGVKMTLLQASRLHGADHRFSHLQELGFRIP